MIIGNSKRNNAKKNKLHSANLYFFRTHRLPNGDIILVPITLLMASLMIHRSHESARRSARRARIRYLQLRTHNKWVNSPAHEELWRFMDEEAAEDAANIQ